MSKENLKKERTFSEKKDYTKSKRWKAYQEFLKRGYKFKFNVSAVTNL